MIAIIPAYLDTSGRPNIYIKKLAGKPLIVYTIESIKKTNEIQRLIVSTDSEEIAKIAVNNGAEVSLLTTSYTSRNNFDSQNYYFDTIESLHKKGTEYNDFIVLDPKFLFRTTDDVNRAIQLYKDKNSDPVVSFCEINQSGFIAKQIVENIVSEFLEHSPETGNSFIKEKALIPNGAISIFNYQYMKENGLNCADKTYPYIMPAEKSIRVTTLSDFEYAEFLVLKNNNNLSTLDGTDIHKYKVNIECTIRESILKLDETGIGFITVVNQVDKVLGVVTDGDFRRAVLSGVQLNAPLSTITNLDFVYLNEGYTREELEQAFLNDISQIPVLNDGKLTGILLRKNLPVISNQSHKKQKLDIPVVIMAGGKGTRLEPFTHIMPKPLIPIGNKPIIEIIIEKFVESGINKFYLSLNYKANMIKAYFEGRSITDMLHYVIEEIPLGTAGALRKLKEVIKTTFIVSNCDIIIKSDYAKIVDFHHAGKYDLTLVACLQHYTIPYGVCYTENGGRLREISEKPEYDYLVNTGMYVLEPDLIDLIPENSFYNITDLINELLKDNRKVGVYPVYEKSWIDVGQWEEYKNAIKYFQ